MLFGVEELKNVFQLVVISETAALDEPAGADGGADGADCAGDGAVAEADVPGVEVALVEQAAVAVTSTRPSAGTR